MSAPDPSKPLACSVQRYAEGPLAGLYHIQCGWKPNRTGIFSESEALALALLILETIVPEARVIVSGRQFNLPLKG